MAEYRFVTHENVPDRVRQVSELNTAAFSGYEGAPVLDEAFTRWYLQRPGCTAGRCVGALDGDELVSMVLVAIEPLQIGGEVLDCGIIDSVATHPDHRRQGLARRLMNMAHEIMQADAAEAAVLYTNPDEFPYKFYQDLGYQTRATCQMMRGSKLDGQGSVPLEIMQPEERDNLAELLDEFYGDHEGYAPMGPDLLNWHKIARPAGMEAAVMMSRSNGRLGAAATYAEIELLLEGERSPVAVISDFAWRPDTCEGREVLKTMLTVAPQESLVCVVDEKDPLMELFEGVGFERGVREVSMVLPFTDEAREALDHTSGPWYPMVESIIGV